jgi:hypothetical protein
LYYYNPNATIDVVIDGGYSCYTYTVKDAGAYGSAVNIDETLF